MDTYFGKLLFMSTPIIREELKQIENLNGATSITGLVASCKSLSKQAMIFNTLPYKFTEKKNCFQLVDQKLERQNITILGRVFFVYNNLLPFADSNTYKWIYE